MKLALALLAACAPAFADSPKQEEILAAIQKAMNELVPASQQCWAAAATERYDIAGDLTAQIDVRAAGANAVIVHDTVANDTLASCMAAVLSKYRYAPPLVGQTFQLPFHFDAPHGQSVIDRRLVASKTQAGITFSVLLDGANSGNAAASMAEVTIGKGRSLRGEFADRDQLWYFLDGRADDVLFVPRLGMRPEFAAGAADVPVVLVEVPGGKEGTMRAGALPGPRSVDKPFEIRKPVTLSVAKARTYGPATIILDDSIVHGTPLAASILQLSAGAKVAEHVHEHETEMLYVLAGSGTVTIAGVELPVTATSVIQIPPNTKHAFVAAEAVRTLQIYTPAGPEQRFKKKP